MSFFRRNIYLLLPCLICFIAGAWINLQYTQKEIFYWVNAHNSSFLDNFFRYYTNIGDGLFLNVIVLGLLFINFRKGIILFSAWAVSGITTQVLKLLVFPHERRPWFVLGEDKNIHLVSGFNPPMNNSFPSGHSATAFCLFAILSIFSENKKTGLLFFLLAALAAYSRIYLVDHFFTDTYFGAMIGIVSAIIMWFLLKNILDKPWGHKNLLTLKNKPR